MGASMKKKNAVAFEVSCEAHCHYVLSPALSVPKLSVCVLVHQTALYVAGKCSGLYLALTSEPAFVSYPAMHLLCGQKCIGWTEYLAHYLSNDVRFELYELYSNPH